MVRIIGSILILTIMFGPGIIYGLAGILCNAYSHPVEKIVEKTAK